MWKYWCCGTGLWTVASVAAAGAVNTNGIKALLANGLSKLIKGKPVFSNGTRSLPKNPPDCPILYNWVFVNFILADELFARALWSLETYVLVNNNLYGKLVSSLELPIIFDESLNVASEPFFNADFSLLSCEVDNFTFKVLY